MNQVKFEDVRDRLIKRVDEILNECFEENKEKLIPNEKTLSLIPGFLDLPLTTIYNKLTIGGPNVPTVALVGSSGRVYLFALKALLPGIFDETD